MLAEFADTALVSVALVGYGADYSRGKGDHHGENYGFGSRGDKVKEGKLVHRGAESEACKYGERYYPILDGRRHDYGDEHTEYGNAQRADGKGWDYVSHDDAQGGAHRPTGEDGEYGSVGVGRLYISFSCDVDGENLVGQVKADEKPVIKRGVGGEFLGLGAGHEKVSGVCDYFHESHLCVPCSGSDKGNGCVLSCGSVVEKACHERLKSGKSRLARVDSESE